MENPAINQSINSKTIDDNYSIKNNYIYKNYSINECDFPKNFVPILKPKDLIFGNEENIIPFSLNPSCNENDRYINNYNFSCKNNKRLICNIKSNKKVNLILGKLIKKRQLSKQ